MAWDAIVTQTDHLQLIKNRLDLSSSCVMFTLIYISHVACPQVNMIPLLSVHHKSCPVCRSFNASDQACVKKIGHSEFVESGKILHEADLRGAQ